jgi:hypothetical protein
VINVDGSVIAFRSDAFDFVADDTNDRPDVFVSDLTNPVMLASRADVTVPNLSGNESSGLQSSTRRQVLSEDGRYLIFQSDVSNLVPNDTNGLTDVFRYDRQTGEILLISASVGGADSGNGYSTGHVISADGNRIAFTSAASDLIANDDNGGTEDVFVRDVAAGTTTLVSIRMDELGSGDSISFGPIISADGNVVAFESYASDLTANDTDFNGNVFTRNLGTDTTTLVSVRPDGVNGGDSGSSSPAISADGNMVAFMSYASDLVANDTNSNRDVFVRDISGETTTLISARPDGPDSGDSYSYNPTISANGNVIAFESHASNLVANDGNFSADVFVRDLSDASAVLVSALPENSDSGDSFSGNATISGDGNVVAFVSTASDLVPNDDNSTADVFARDLSTGATTIVSAVPDGTNGGNSSSVSAAIKSDGTVVVFRSFATDLVIKGTNASALEVFSRNLTAGTTQLITLASNGLGGGNAESGWPTVSADGSTVAFDSYASNLVPGDYNQDQDVFAFPLDVVPQSSVAFDTASGFSVDIDVHQHGTGQLIQGPVNAFDGLNRLQIDGIDFDEGSTISEPVASSEVLPVASLQSLDTTWTDANGLATSLSLDTSSLVRIKAKVGISNFSLSDAAINLRFVVDGQPGTELAYIVGGDESLSLDAEDLQRLEAGDHDIKVQIRRFNTISGATYLDSFAGARTHLLEVAAVRTLDTVSAEVLSTSSSFTLDSTWVDAGDLSTTLSLNTDSVVRLTGKIGSATPVSATLQ